MIDDLTALHDAWTPAKPSHSAYVHARAALLDRATPKRRRRRVPRIALAGALAVATAAAALFVDLGGGEGQHHAILSPVPAASAAVTLERAAKAAERTPFTAPRDDQWIYFKDQFTPLGGGAPRVQESWHEADGEGVAFIDDNGKLNTQRIELPKKRREQTPRPLPGPLDSYKAIADLPADPGVLLRWAYEDAKNITGGGVDDNGDVYLLFNGMLRDHLLPPDLKAAIFRALKQVPGVTVEPIDVGGRPALSLGMGTADWLHEELLLDPTTYAYMGERSTVTRDTIVNKEKVGNNTGRVKKGQQVFVLRQASGIVDNAGERP